MMSLQAKDRWLSEFNERKDFPFKVVANSNIVYGNFCEKQFTAAQKSVFGGSHGDCISGLINPLEEIP